MSQSQIDIDDNEGSWAPAPRWLLHGNYFESSLQKLLWIALADQMDSHGFCQPSLSLLAHDAMCSQSTVLENLRRLEALGLIMRCSRMTEDGKYLPDEYHVPLERPFYPEEHVR